jgi:ZIP family zinc transporter
MEKFLLGMSHVQQAFLAACLTWAITALGAGAIFAFPDVGRSIMDALLGFASGVMIAASYWSLLAPSIEMSGGLGIPIWLPPAVGFLAGAGVLRALDWILPHLHLFAPPNEAEGIKTSWQRTSLLVWAITLHNIPEGLAVGVAFGAVAAGLPEATIGAAVALAIGIGLQNFPEGLAVAMPLRREGMSRMKSFFYGQLTAVVEPVAAVVGAAAVLASRAILPYAMAFAAGAMIFVVVEEALPESQRGGHTDLATMGVMAGFVTMMILDIAFK